MKAPSDIRPPVPEVEPVIESVVQAEAEPMPTQDIEMELDVADAKPTPNRVAKKDQEFSAPKPTEPSEPEVLVRSQANPPAQFSERPEPTLPEFELPIARTPSRPTKMLDDELVVETETTSARPSRDAVQLFFEEDAPTDGDRDENMDFVERESEPVMKLAESDEPSEDSPEMLVEPMPSDERQVVAVEEQPNDPTTSDTAATVEGRSPLSDVILAELKPVRSIEIRKAVEVPPLAEMDNPQLREPADLAGAMLRKRTPFKFWPVYRDPWVANRDSFAFHHNPLWFEDPNLERCGRGTGHFSSVCSFLQFNTNIAFLPYRMTAEPWHSCVRTLPDCTVCEKFGCDAYLPPWSWRAAAVQAGCIVGFIYAIP